MNSIVISGRLTRDPELRATANGKHVTSFSVAVSRPGVKDMTDFIECVAWEKTAEFVARYFEKGKWIEVTGVLTTRDYEDKEGRRRKATEIRADSIGFGGVRRAEDTDRDRKDVPDFSTASDSVSESLPF